jgi:hypothetical protein
LSVLVYAALERPKPRSIGYSALIIASTSTNFAQQPEAGSRSATRADDRNFINYNRCERISDRREVDFKTSVPRASACAPPNLSALSRAIYDDVEMLPGWIRICSCVDAALLRIASFSVRRPITSKLHPVRHNLRAQSNQLPSPITQTRFVWLTCNALGDFHAAAAARRQPEHR